MNSSQEVLPAFHLQTFGQFLLVHAASGTAVPVPAGKAQALFAVMALAKKPILREWLANFLWPESSVTTGRFNLRHTFFHLRRLCGDALFMHSRDQIGINTVLLGLDVTTLSIAAEKFKTETLDLSVIEEILATCSSEFLTDFQVAGCDDLTIWLEEHRKIFCCQQVSLLEDMAERRQSEGRLDLGIRHARRLKELTPYDDGACRRLMQMLIDAGSPLAAFAEFTLFAALLRLHIGAEPQEKTVKLAALSHLGTETKVARIDRSGPVSRQLIHKRAMPAHRESRIVVALYGEVIAHFAEDPVRDMRAPSDEDPNAQMEKIFDAVTLEHGGIPVRSGMGGVLAYFECVAAPMEATMMAIAAGLATCTRLSSAGLSARIGAHAGYTVCDGKRHDIFNSMARISQRICLVADEGEFVVSEALQQVDARYHLTALGEKSFRGLSKPYTIFRVRCSTPVLM